MDVKLMLALTFTTIVVVAGSPLQADIEAGPPWAIANSRTTAEAQLRSRGDCTYITLKDRSYFCVQLAVTNKGQRCIHGLNQYLPQCSSYKGHCDKFYIRDAQTIEASFEICHSRYGTYCYLFPSLRVCNPRDVVQMEQDDDNCICVEDGEGNKVCSPEACDRLVHMEQDEGCICVEDSKGNKVCTPAGCDVALKQSDNKAECVCVKNGGDGKVVCSPPGCDSSSTTNEFFAELSKLQ